MASRWKSVLGGVIVLFLSLFAWGNLIEPRWVDEVHLEAAVPRLPKAWQGRRIAFIADLQIGMPFGNPGTVEDIVDRIIAGRPAAVLIGGDFIYHPTEDDSETEAREEYDEEEVAEARSEIRQVTRIVEKLVTAGLSVYAVLGNHDYAMESQESLKLEWVAEEIAAALEGISVTVLRNGSVALQLQNGSRQDGRLYLVGIGPHYPGEDDVKKAFAGLPPNSPRIVLMHSPQTFARIPAAQAPLALAGHSHGGQIRIPFLPGWSWLSIVREHEVHSDGWIKNYGEPGNHLYVNRGIGFSIVPIRVNCRPELTWITLSAG